MATAGVNLIGYLSSEKGLGEAARGLIRSLTAAGIGVARNEFIDTGSANPGLIRPLREGLPYDTTILALNPDNYTNFSRQVDVPRLLAGRRTIGYWFWEQPELPHAWATDYDWFDEVWVGSTYTQQAVARALRVPVIVVPPSLEPHPAVDPIPRATLRLKDSTFVVLFIFDAASVMVRKNPVGLIEAFQRAFPPGEDAALLIKVSRLDWSPDREELLQAVRRDSRVQLLGGVLSPAGLQGLMSLADCYASLHRSEGFGLTMAEAMRLGKPVVATDHSGNLDFMTRCNSRLVNYRLVALDRDHGPYQKGLEWAEPDLADAAMQLRWVCDNRDRAAALGAQARTDVCARHDATRIGAVIARRLALAPIGHVKNIPPSPATWTIQTLLNYPGKVVPVEARTAMAVPFRMAAPAHASPVRLTLAWRSHRGEPVQGLEDSEGVIAPPTRTEYPATVVSITIPAFPGLGDFILKLNLGDGAALADVPVHVTGRQSEAINYRAVYAHAKLDVDHWSVVGPKTEAEFVRLGRVKRDLLVNHGLTPQSLVLDVGCGTGQVAGALAEILAADGAYHGTDLAPEAVAFCRARFHQPNFRFSQGAAAALGDVGGPYDMICFFSVFTHTSLTGTAALLADAAARLAPGGAIIADAFVSPMVRQQAGHRGAVESNPECLQDLIAAVPLTATEFQAEPWGPWGRRVFLRMTRP